MYLTCSYHPDYNMFFASCNFVKLATLPLSIKDQHQLKKELKECKNIDDLETIKNNVLCDLSHPSGTNANSS